MQLITDFIFTRILYQYWMDLNGGQHLNVRKVIAGGAAGWLPEYFLVIGLKIHICPAAIAKGEDYLVRIFIHEAGHGFVFIFIPDDLCEGGWSGSTTDAEDNADCYGEFASEAMKL